MTGEDAHGRLLRLVAPHGAYNWIEWPSDAATWLSRKRGALTSERLRRGHPVGVRPSPWRAVFLALDVDKNSPYHPSRSPDAIDRLRSLLENQGIEGVITVESSASTGIHLWAPLLEQPTRELARWLFQIVSSAGYKVAPGVLELFPNLAAPGKFHNGIRLPLIAPDSWVLDNDLNPDHQNIHRLCDQWECCLEWNAGFTVESFVSDAPAAARRGLPAEAWKRLKRSWSGHGQTWSLAYDAAYIASCEELRGSALHSRMCKLMSEAPGCQAWSRHWREISAGTYAPGLAKYYSERGASYRAHKQGVGSQAKGEKPLRDPEYNAKLSAGRRSVLASAARELKEAGMSFPTQTAAINYLIKHLKATTGTGMSKSTLYHHLDLVRPLIQRLIGQPPDLPQGMGLGDPILSGDVGEQGAGAILLAAHPLSAVGPFPRGWAAFSAAS